jgi:DNA-binding GntR family transcriptional regulator
MKRTEKRMKFEPVRRESTREKVYGAIREAVLDGRLRLGQRLTEISLAKDFGVSRAVIREALQQLGHDGLIEQNAYRGSQVVNLTPEQVDEIISTRIVLESEAVRKALVTITTADIRHLEDLTKRIQDPKSDTDIVSELDLAFHEKIWELSGNSTLRKILLQITAPLFAMGSIMRHARRGVPQGTKIVFRRSSHTAVIEALKSGKEAKAVEAIQRHVAENWELIRKHLVDYLESDSDKFTKPQRPVPATKRATR